MVNKDYHKDLHPGIFIPAAEGDMATPLDKTLTGLAVIEPQCVA